MPHDPRGQPHDGPRTRVRKSGDVSARAGALGPTDPGAPSGAHALITLSTRQQLAEYVRDHLGHTLARTPLSAEADAPLDYLEHTFFERGDAVVWANRGGGKTVLAAIATLLDLVFKDGIEVRLLGGSLEQSARMYEHLTAFFALPAFRPLVHGRVARRGFRLISGSRVEIMAQSETSVRGTRVQRVRCDEVDLFSREVWAAVQLTTRSIEGGPGKRAIRASIDALSTMQRPYGVMWEVVSETAGGGPFLTGEARSSRAAQARLTDGPGTPAARRLFRWGVIDSLQHCGPERVCATCALQRDCDGRAKARPPESAGHISIDDALAQCSRVGRAQWEAEMLCLRPRRDHTVFPEFREERHVFGHADEPLDPATILSAKGKGSAAPALYCGMDFGFRHKTAVLWCTLDSAGMLTVVDELVSSERPLHYYLAAIRESPLGLPRLLAVDPAGEQHSLQTGTSVVEDLRRAGLKVCSRASSILTGLAMIRARLDPSSGPPTLRVHRRCRGLIESLHRYHFDEARPHLISPVKDGFDHAIDALRYLIIHTDSGYAAASQQY